MNKIEVIGNYLDSLFSKPRPVLKYNTDYEFLIAIMLSAQTTDMRVNEVTRVLFSKYKSLEELSQADITELESIIRPLGSFRKKALYIHEISTILLNKYNGCVPKDKEKLISLPGVGVKTSNVFLSEYYGVPAIAVDTHVNRVSKRLGLSKDNDSVEVVEDKLEKLFPKELWSKRHLQLVFFGRKICHAIKPDCSNCKLKDICNYYNKSK